LTFVPAPRTTHRTVASTWWDDRRYRTRFLTRGIKGARPSFVRTHARLPFGVRAESARGTGVKKEAQGRTYLRAPSDEQSKTPVGRSTAGRPINTDTAGTSEQFRNRSMTEPQETTGV
jgi:hypothetical protein